MQLNTRHFGELEVDENGIIDFPEGIPGFEDLRRFILLGEEQEEPTFQWLQSVDNPELAFVIIQPILFKPDYDIEIEESDVQLLNLKDVTKIMIYSIVVVPEDASKMTANLKAPIIINTENRKGKQVILEKGGYRTKHYLMEELQKNGGNK